MSFIIKGIDIPKTCRQCPCCADNGLVGVQRDCYCAALDCAPSVDDLDQKLIDCPLVEIPTLHGRLIDADEVLDDFMLAYPVYSPELECAFEIIENADEFFKAEVSE